MHHYLPQYAVISINRVTRAETAIRMMLYLHSIFGMVMAVLIPLRVPNTPSFTVISLLPGYPWTWALTLFCSCLTCFVGRLTKRMRMTRLGLAGMLCWAAGVAVGYASAAVKNDAILFVIPLYVMLAGLYAVHLTYLEDS